MGSQETGLTMEQRFQALKEADLSPEKQRILEDVQIPDPPDLHAVIHLRLPHLPTLLLLAATVDHVTPGQAGKNGDVRLPSFKLPGQLAEEMRGEADFQGK